MNLILFDKPFDEQQLASEDPRAKHIRETLRADVGTPRIPRLCQWAASPGKGGLARRWQRRSSGRRQRSRTGVIAPRSPCWSPRPHSARKVLFESACLGVRQIHFFEAERGEPSYARSSLWTTDEWRDRLRLGVEQSFATHLPEVAVYPDLQTALNNFYQTPLRIALDNYEAAQSLQDSLSENVSPPL